VRINRRDVLAASAFAGLGLSFGVHTASAQPVPSRSVMNRLRVGAIGLRYQGSVIAHKAQLYGDITAVCDVDRNVRDQAKAAFGSPDHWHTKMVIDACRAGKDVYCEKPLTLTVDEGKQLTKVVEETGRIVQVGSWQRSDDRFRLAVELVRGGRIGKLQKVDVVLGKNGTSGSFVSRTPPAHLNWNLWQGQTPDVPYIEERTHYTFRWWYEYSGGQMTDWGAHHIDIAHWAINSEPIEVYGTARMPGVANGYNVAVDFHATYTFANGVVMTVSDHGGDNGILFTGDAGRLFVNRGKITGAPVDALKTQPLKREDWKVYDYDNLERPARAGKLDAIVNHMGNFFDCVQSRRTPVSDVMSSHRSVSTCHLGNISMRLGRPLKWDPVKEEFIDDKEANTWQKREQRQGFETV
jgi:myo-inositol 2-dehydrogenase / D-chiro-inositol 1-dehydrogenase